MSNHVELLVDKLNERFEGKQLKISQKKGKITLESIVTGKQIGRAHV